MAIVRQSRIWNGIPVRIDTNTETGASFVYSTGGLNRVGLVIGGDKLLFTSQGKGNDWKVNDANSATMLFNAANNRNATEEEVTRAFLLEGHKIFDNDRAYVLNSDNSYDNLAQAKTRRKTFWEQGTPRITNPFDNTQVNSDGKKTTTPIEPKSITRSTQTQVSAGLPNNFAGFSGDTSQPLTEGDRTVNVKETDKQTENPNAQGSTNMVAQVPGGNVSVSNAFGMLRYPLANLDVTSEIGISYDYIKITAQNFVGSIGGLSAIGDDDNLDTVRRAGQRDLFGARRSAVERYSETRASLGTIVLPMIGSISSANGINWGSQNMNAIEMALGNVVGNMFSTQQDSNISQGVLAGLRTAMTEIGVGLDEFQQNQQALAALLAGFVVGNTQVLTRSTGQVLNPNMELLFGGPKLRTFRFNFNFAPRFGKEAETVARIIKALKQSAAPKLSRAGGIFLQAPDVFQIQYIYNGGAGGGTEHPYLNKIKPCALTNISVNYTPGNTYMTYNGDDDGVGRGSMVQTTLDMTFQELEPIYAQDYADDSHLVGY